MEPWSFPLHSNELVRRCENRGFLDYLSINPILKSHKYTYTIRRYWDSRAASDALESLGRSCPEGERPEVLSHQPLLPPNSTNGIPSED